MNITVYLGANKGIDDTFSIAVRELGKWIGANGHTLIYGGSKTGLMGELAESVLMEGGRVTGVEPQFFVEAEVQYDEITELIVTKDMTERKTKMIELGDAFIAFPGGTGTLEEITEVMSKRAYSTILMDIMTVLKNFCLIWLQWDCQLMNVRKIYILHLT